MSEQLLDGHNVYTSIDQTRRKCMTQRIPRHTRDSGLPAGESESGFEINKRFAGMVVVKYEVVLSA